MLPSLAPFGPAATTLSMVSRQELKEALRPLARERRRALWVQTAILPILVLQYLFDLDPWILGCTGALWAVVALTLKLRVESRLCPKCGKSFFKKQTASGMSEGSMYRRNCANCQLWIDGRSV